ncbi:MAG: hypothetical protein NTZ37_01650 [Methanoregula sp.]|nr:hypothetical protein [Methanoregula sp.]
MAYLTNIIVSVAMIWYLINFFVSCSTCAAKPLTFTFFVAFCAIIVISGLRLSEILFSVRKRSCPVCSLISRFVEIDFEVYYNTGSPTFHYRKESPPAITASWFLAGD